MDNDTARSHLISLRDALARGARADANAIALALVAGAAPLGRQWKAIATLLQHNGEVSGARAAMDFHVAAMANNPAALYDKAALLAQTASVSAAFELLQSLPADVPDRHANAYSRGTMALNLGHFDAARTALREALDAAPTSGQARLALAMIGKIVPEDAARIRADEAAITNQTPFEQAAWRYALGRLHEAEGRVDAAWADYAAGAAIMARLRVANLKEDRDDAQQSTNGWNAGAIADYGKQTAMLGPSRPIFVTGLPRSGTTLVEQILVSHSAVDGGDELGLMRLVVQDLGGSSRPALEGYLAKGGNIGDLRQLYDHLLTERFPGTNRIVDKALNSSRSIGLIASLFPDAPIVWVRRDPLDCAWSAFKTWFNQGLDWSWSLQAMAYHFKLEDALFFHWRKILPGRIKVVPYEDLVTRPRETVEGILEYCQLPFEEQVLAPEKTQRAVTTASVAQVRDAINIRAIGSSKPFHAFLRPFVHAYSSSG